MPCRVTCDSCGFSSPLELSPKEGHIYDVNRPIVFSFKAIGKGLTSQERFSALMDMPPPLSKRSYSEHSNAILVAVSKVVDENASAQLLTSRAWMRN